MATQPIASLPLPSKQTTPDRLLAAANRVVAAGCAVDDAAGHGGVGRPVPVRSGKQGPAEQLRERVRRTQDRCLPRRECFTGLPSVRTGGIANSPFRTPPFRGR